MTNDSNNLRKMLDKNEIFFVFGIFTETENILKQHLVFDDKNM